MTDMNTVNEFYRKRKILEEIQKWRSPFVYYLSDDNKVSILFQSDVRSLLTSKEEAVLSRKVISFLECGEFSARNFVKGSENELAKLKAVIKKDFDL